MWRTIDTAPKDGTPVLLFYPDGEPQMNVMFASEYQKSGWMGYYDGIAPRGNPTHWMPLPDPPTSPERKDDE